MNGDKSTAHGHRGRVRSAYIAAGAHGMPVYQLLELLLFYSIPRKDTKPLAKALEKQFDKSLEKLFSADRKTLLSIDGVGEKTADFILCIGSALKKLDNPDITHVAGAEVFDELLALKAFVNEQLENEKKAGVFVITLSNKKQMLGFNRVADADSIVAADTKAVAECTLGSGAAAIVVVTYRPDGKYVPTPEEMQKTKSLVRFMFRLGISVNEHIICASDGTLCLSQDCRYAECLDL